MDRESVAPLTFTFYSGPLLFNFVINDLFYRDLESEMC